MTSNPGKQTTSVLPLDARTARIAACGGLATCAHEFPAGSHGVQAEDSEPNQDTTAHCIEAAGVRLRPASPVERQPNETIHHN